MIILRLPCHLHILEVSPRLLLNVTRTVERSNASRLAVLRHVSDKDVRDFIFPPRRLFL